MRELFNEIKSLYDQVRSKRGRNVERDIFVAQIFEKSTALLGNFEILSLVSRVPQKSYFCFRGVVEGRQKLSRAINSDLYFPNLVIWQNFVEGLKSGELDEGGKENFLKVIYTVAISFCAVNDIFADRDQKTPGTFFEHFISYLIRLRLQVDPVQSIQVLDYDGLDVSLPTDLIFNLGAAKPKFHVPVKTSTRERAIMLWAHQKLLDGVYGIEKFVGMPVLLTETKTEARTYQVTEICLPDQWLVYQLYISKLKRVYYLDMPDAYKRLAYAVPPINVKPFIEFFFEWEEVYSH